MEEIQAEIVAPFFYGAMPNQGLYYAPDGPYGNPADLMREFKIEESMQQSELASAHVTRDIEYVATRLQAAGSDGFNFDTTGSAGDADCVGTLNGVKKLREQCPEAYIQVGFAGESIMGIHGSIEFEGQVVAGMYPRREGRCERLRNRCQQQHQQVPSIQHRQGGHLHQGGRQDLQHPHPR